METILKSTRFVKITSDTCRVCLRDIPVQNILKSFSATVADLPEPQTLGAIYETCTGHSPAFGPQNVCVVCEASLIKFYLFRLEVEAAETFIRSSVKRPESPQEESRMVLIVERPVVEVDEDLEFFDDSDLEGIEEERLDGVEEPDKTTQVICKKTCSFCRKVFSTAAHMKQHLKIHLGVKEFKCETCEPHRFFRTSSQLKTHQVSHGDVRRHECPTCKKRFKLKRTLNEHLETHSSTVQFFCEFCNHGFTTKAAMRIHILRRHRTSKTTE